MGSFDQGYAGMASLTAVNQWIGVINSNLGGSNRTAYKATRVSFGGGITQQIRDPRADAQGVQLPASTLNVDHTRVDFQQGTIIQDGELTHVAIQGDGFFGITDGTTTFYTRDGEFKWSVLGTTTILTTASGYTVLNNTGGLAAAGSITRIGSGSTFAVTTTTVTGASACIGVFRFSNNQALKFSRFGSTVFDANAAGVLATRSTVTDVDIIQSGLESSNAALNDTLPELSLAQKLFSAVSKIINVHNTDLDTVVNLIR